MKPSTSEPIRLPELRSQDDPAHLARLVRSAQRAPAEPVPQLKGRIRCSLRRRSVRRQRALRATLLCGLVLLAGGVMAAVMQPILHSWRVRKEGSVVLIDSSRPANRPRPRRASPPRAAMEGLSSPEETSDPPGLPPTLAPPSAHDQPSPVRLEPSTTRIAALEPRGESATAKASRTHRASFKTPDRAMAREEPRPARREEAEYSTYSNDERRSGRGPQPPGRRGASFETGSWALPTSAPAPERSSLNPPAARASRRKEPLRAAMLDPPSWPSERPLAPALASTPASTPSASAVSALSPPRPLPSGNEAPSPSMTLGKNGPPPSSAAPAPNLAAPTSKPSLALPGEQVLLAKAIRSLRSEHQPASALATLDEYMARFPNGNLLPEAIRLRTETLLALGQKPAALAELNRGPIPGGAGRAESRLVRGELHAAAGRWQEALEDFDGVVRAFETSSASSGSGRSRERLERALWGRASARSHLGDDAGARADLRECLRLFPQGRLADQVAHLLGEQR
jgi:hypothetical protein